MNHHIENLEQLPNGKTELPATVTVNKMGTAVTIQLDLQLKLEKKEKKSIMPSTEISPEQI